MSDQEIPQVAQSCDTILSELVNATKSTDNGEIFGISQRDVQQIQERYQQWAGNIGALQPSGSTRSLAYRLRTDSSVRIAVWKMIRDLQSSAQIGTITRQIKLFLSSMYANGY